MAQPLLPGYSVVIPCYGSERTLETVCLGLRNFFSSELPNVAWEIVLVNDDSPDGVQTVIDRLRKNPSFRIRAFRMIRNFGQHAALLAGMRQVRYSTTITMDDDGQHPLAPLAEAIRCFHEKKLHVLYLTPLKRGHGWVRDVLSNASKFCERWILGIRDAQEFSAYRIFRSEITAIADGMHTNDFCLSMLFEWGCSRVGTFPIEHKQRLAGRSGYNWRRLLTHWWRCTFSRTTRPLLFPLFLGCLLFPLGGVLLLFAPWNHFCLIPGALLFMGSLFFLSLGLFGEYLARIYKTTQGRPTYVLFSLDEDRVITERTSERI